MARSATGVVGVAATLFLIWLFRVRFEPPRRGLWPRLPLLIQGGEPLSVEFRDRNGLGDGAKSSSNGLLFLNSPGNDLWKKANTLGKSPGTSSFPN